MTDEFATNSGGAGTPMTRRAALNRIGVGAAAAWAVPMFVSTTGAAARAGFSPSDCPTSNCGSPAAHSSCARFLHANNNKKSKTTFCGNCGPCTHVEQYPCGNNSDCPSGWKCGYTCCASSQGYCVPPCGHEYVAGGAARGAGTSCAYPVF